MVMIFNDIQSVESGNAWVGFRVYKFLWMCLIQRQALERRQELH